MSALGQGLFFLLPELMVEKGYPDWLVKGGALLWIIVGSSLGLCLQDFWRISSDDAG